MKINSKYCHLPLNRIPENLKKLLKKERKREMLEKIIENQGRNGVSLRQDAYSFSLPSPKEAKSELKNRTISELIDVKLNINKSESP